jgi:orotate phosphoribosyltransferase-like protein
MHDEKTVQRFIELRSQGWPFSKIAAELNVSKPEWHLV